MQGEGCRVQGTGCKVGIAAYDVSTVLAAAAHTALCVDGKFWYVVMVACTCVDAHASSACTCIQCVHIHSSLRKATPMSMHMHRSCTGAPPSA